MTNPVPAEYPTEARWPAWQKQIVAIFLILLVPVTLIFLRPVLSALLAMVGISFILMYIIRLLQKLKLSYKLATALVYLIFLILSLVLLVWIITSAITSVIDTLTNAQEFITNAITRVQGDVVATDSSALAFLQRGKSTLSILSVGASIVSSPTDFFASIVNKFSAFASFLTGYALILTLLPFFLFEWPRTKEAIGKRMSPTSRREYGILITRSIGLGQSFVVGSLLVALFYWLLATVQFALTGVPHPIAMGFVVGMPNFIPQVGGMVSAVLVFIIVLVSGSQTIAINVLLLAFFEMAAFMIISGITYYFVDARIYARSVRMPIWVILLGIVAFSAAFGLVGAILAAAAVAIIGEIIDFVLKKMRDVDPYPDETETGFFAGVDDLVTTAVAHPSEIEEEE